MKAVETTTTWQPRRKTLSVLPGKRSDTRRIAQEENSAPLKIICNPKHTQKKQRAGRSSEKGRRCTVLSRLEVTAGGARMLVNPRSDRWVRSLMLSLSL